MKFFSENTDKQFSLYFCHTYKCPCELTNHRFSFLLHLRKSSNFSEMGYWMQLGYALSNIVISTHFSSNISRNKFPSLAHFIFPAAPLPVLVLPFISHNIRSAWGEERHHINHHRFYLWPHWQFLKHTQTLKILDLTHPWALRALGKVVQFKHLGHLTGFKGGRFRARYEDVSEGHGEMA